MCLNKLKYLNVQTWSHIDTYQGGLLPWVVNSEEALLVPIVCFVESTFSIGSCSILDEKVAQCYILRIGSRSIAAVEVSAGVLYLRLPEECGNAELSGQSIVGFAGAEGVICLGGRNEAKKCSMKVWC